VPSWEGRNCIEWVTRWVTWRGAAPADGFIGGATSERGIIIGDSMGKSQDEKKYV